MYLLTNANIQHNSAPSSAANSRAQMLALASGMATARPGTDQRGSATTWRDCRGAAGLPT
eukprot:6256372-Pyramimonas_sp.AAC.1